MEVDEEPTVAAVGEAAEEAGSDKSAEEGAPEAEEEEAPQDDGLSQAAAIKSGQELSLIHI